MIKRYLLFSLVLLLFVLPFVSAASFNISERTEFGISENIVFLRVCDNVGKAQYIDVSSVFVDDVLTRGIFFDGSLFMKQPFNNVVFESVLSSIGKYSGSNVSINNLSGTSYNYTHYFDSKGIEMLCDSVLVDKSCMQTKSVNTRNFTSMEYQALPVLKEKIVVDSLKIEQKSEGIPLMKGGCVDLRYSYKHPLAYRLEVPLRVNKYDIWIDNGVESAVLDPLWWNLSYDKKMLINCSGMSAGTPLVINGSAGFNLGSGSQIVWTNCQENLSVYYVSTNTTNWAIANDTTQVAWDTEVGNVSSYNGADVFSDNSRVYLLNNNAYDAKGVYNLTADGVISGTGVSGFAGTAYSFDGSNDRVYGSDAGLPTGASPYSFCLWYKPIKAGAVSLFSYGTQSNYQMRILISDGVGLNYTLDIYGVASTNTNIQRTLNSWNYFCLNFNGTHVIGMNNLTTFSVSAPSIPNTVLGGTSAFSISKIPWGGGYINGSVDNLMIWNNNKSLSFFNSTFQNYLGTAGFGTLGAVETGCVENLSNTSSVFVGNLSCLSSDLMNSSWNYTTFDVAACGFTANSTTTFYVQNVSCDFCVPSIFGVNNSCLINDTFVRWYNDTNNCYVQTGLGSDNVSVNETYSCNYCSFNPQYSVVGDWVNVSCVLGDLMNQSTETIQYDANYSSCYAVTNLSSDLWNGGVNISTYLYQLNGTCDFCTANLTNMSWSNWSFNFCMNTSYFNQSRSLVQYDVNGCVDEPNVTFYDFSYNSTACTNPTTVNINLGEIAIIFILALFALVLGLVAKQPVFLLVAALLFGVLSGMTWLSYGALLGVIFLVFTILSITLGLGMAWS
jgi:hypothetical protein